MDTQALAAICRRYGVDLVVGFGSAFRGGADARSDIDIAVRFDPTLAERRVLELASELTALFGDALDLTVINTLDSDTLRFEIFRDGKPLFEAEDGLFCDEASLAIRRYADTAWLRERSRAALARALGRD